MLIQIIADVIFVAIWSAMLAPFLQFAFKLVEGQRNEYRDAYRICFIATFTQSMVTLILPALWGESWFVSSLGPLVGLSLFTYFIAKELGDLKRSFLIALLLEGLTFLFVIVLLALIVAMVFATG